MQSSALRPRCVQVKMLRSRRLTCSFLQAAAKTWGKCSLCVDNFASGGVPRNGLSYGSLCKQVTSSAAETNEHKDNTLCMGSQAHTRGRCVGPVRKSQTQLHLRSSVQSKMSGYQRSTRLFPSASSIFAVELWSQTNDKSERPAVSVQEM